MPEVWPPPAAEIWLADSLGSVAGFPAIARGSSADWD